MQVWHDVSEVESGPLSGGRTVVNHAGMRYRRERRAFDRVSETDPARAVSEVTVRSDGGSIAIDTRR